MELNVRRARGLVGVPEPAGLEQGRGDRAGLEQQILQARPERAVRLRHAIVGVIAGAFADRVEIEMILHVGANARQVVNHRDPGCAQRIGGTDAGELQQSRRADGAAANDHLALGAKGLDAARCADLHADGAAVLDAYLQCRRVQPDREIGSRPRRSQIGARRRRALGIARRQLVMADAVLHRAVEVIVEGNAGLLRRAQESKTDRRRIDRIGHAQRSAIAVIGIDQPLVVLGCA